MGTSTTGALTAEQMQQEAVKQQSMANTANAPATARKLQFFAAFDSTNNNRDDLSLSGSKYQTNVANLFTQADVARSTNDNLKVGYYRGVGTGGEMGNLINAGVAPTGPVQTAAKNVYNDFVYAAQEYIKVGGKIEDVSAAVTGVSRGGPTAIIFSKMLSSAFVSQNVMQ
jgi:hypothetical protein